MARGPSGRQMSSDQGGVGAAQRASSKFLVFSGINKINTKSARDALPARATIQAPHAGAGAMPSAAAAPR